jgi:ribosomal protein S6--L-glutamate ligase
MTVGFIMVRHPPARRSPVVPDVLRRLAAGGLEPEPIWPDEELIELAAVRPRHDLYVLKSGTESALSLAGALHAQGARILNPYPVAVACRDKIVATRILQEAGIPVAESWYTASPRRLAPLLADGPLVVKPYRGSQGKGVRVVREAAELRGLRTDGPTFAQRYHEPDGRDRKLYRIGREVFGVMRVWPARSYEDKLGEPFEVSGELRAIALRAGAAFGIDLYGLDVVVSAGRPYVVDFSSFPGFKGVPDAAGRLAAHIAKAHADAFGTEAA